MCCIRIVGSQLFIISDYPVVKLHLQKSSLPNRVPLAVAMAHLITSNLASSNFIVNFIVGNAETKLTNKGKK